ncbi:MAG: hypothetical protein F7C34_00450, partial [Desulfurococcales archaeon]|nr:hypothetical protein [Desulfurococcales archaeon]
MGRDPVGGDPVDPAGPGANHAVYHQDNIEEGPEWRSYSDGTKGFRRSNSDVSMIYDPSLQRVHYRPHGKATRVKRGMRQSMTKEESLRYKAINLLADVLRRLDLYNNKTVKAAAKTAVEKYISMSKKEGRRITNKELAYLVVAVLEYIIEFSGLSTSPTQVIEAVLSARSSLVSPKDLADNTWKVKKRLNKYGIRRQLQLALAYEPSRRGTQDGVRMCSVGRRALNIIKSHVGDVVGNPYLARIAKKMSEYILVSSIRNGKTLHGKSAEAIAAALLYISARLVNVDVSQKQLARMLGISETNVRKAFKFLVDGQAIIVIPRYADDPLPAEPIAKLPGL